MAIRGGANDVCASGRCFGLTAASLNICVPKEGTGEVLDVCTSRSQCKNNICYIQEKDAKIGLCQNPLGPDTICTRRNLIYLTDDEDAPCKDPANPANTVECPWDWLLGALANSKCK